MRKLTVSRTFLYRNVVLAPRTAQRARGEISVPLGGSAQRPAQGAGWGNPAQVAVPGDR